MQKLEVSARRSATIKGVDSRNHSRRREHEAFVPLDLLAFLTSEVRSRYRGLILRNVCDLEIVDSELRLLMAILRTVCEEEGRPPSSARIDELLDERSAATFVSVIFSDPVPA